uniref:Uncharacterized protein n=1 Tax=Myripristis murdjan TaxID=586833 RepID=A0A668AHP1_9TELE
GEPSDACCADAPLPPVLQRRARVSSGGGPSRFVTTSGSAHSGALQAAWQTQTHYPKPPPHWSTHCLNDLAKRLRESPSLRVVSAPVSEAKHSYRGFPGLKASGRASDDTLLALYRQHEHMPRTVEPLISTSHADHRRFKRYVCVCVCVCMHVCWRGLWQWASTSRDALLILTLILAFPDAFLSDLVFVCLCPPMERVGQ